jgi:two-component system OmpR family sensor kinase
VSWASFRRRGIETPIAIQIVAMLIVGVLVGQVVTLLIVTLLPPPRPPAYPVSEIAAALKGQPVRAQDGRPLVRRLSDAPGFANGGRPAFVDASRLELAGLLGVGEDRVLLNVGHPRPPVWELPFLGAPGHRPPPEGFGRPFSRPRWGSDGPMPWRAREHIGVVFGPFDAAWRLPSGGWAVVRPAPEPFPNPWQSRVIVWFLGCLAVFGPAGYLFARRLVRPITAFAQAAERLGRDPRASQFELRGPSEIGAAARAFNDMQGRLKRYVDDRLAMIGAISHDLRTPLTRIRFKLESAPPQLRQALTADIDQMEAMITAALAFVQDATRTPDREQLDLLSVLECVVDDARSTGGDVTLSGATLEVDGDALALQRLFANLVDNALKYGRRARIRLFAEAGDAVVEVADDGAGLPADELERVFEPFYRTERSRSRDTGGIGLGLAVARSVARGHGGDVELRSGEGGLVATVRLPLRLGFNRDAAARAGARARRPADQSLAG